MQVAETFSFAVDPGTLRFVDDAASAMIALSKGVGDTEGGPRPPEGGKPPAARIAAVGEALGDLARLDTCVTVVDASNLLDNLHSLQTLKVPSPPLPHH